MKKFTISLVLVLALMMLVGCSNKSGNTIDITEDMYLSWVNEIYSNEKDYIGKTIKIEGMYSTYDIESEDATYNLVYRVGPGCCGTDGDLCGFEFESDNELPNENDWIEITGVLGYYDVNGTKYLTIKDAQINVKEERGQEIVGQ